MTGDRGPSRLPLQRLLSPRSLALVGASAKADSIAGKGLSLLLDSGYGGAIFPVNPKYRELQGLTCYPDLAALPAVPDLVVFAISGLALETSFRQALALGVGGIVMFAANHLVEDSTPPLPDRLRDMARAAGVPVCGGNSMGFYNYDDNVFVSFDRPPERPAGHIALIAHSGSAMTYLANNDRRFCFNLVVSSGQETHGTVADYIQFAIDRPSTRVVALFLEAVRDAPGFVAALENARTKDVPVVILKLGRTEKSAAHALSHSGAIVGDYDVFAALCRRHNAVLVRDADELITTAMLFAAGRRPGAPGVAGILDSGGMREQMMDLAADYEVVFTDIKADTRARMLNHLDHGLEPDNPLDAMGALGRNSEETYRECGRALLDDPETGLLTCEFEFRDGFSHYPEIFNALHDLHAYSDKPVVAVNSSVYASLTDTAAELSHRGIPCINGIDLALRSIRNLVNHHRQSGSGTPGGDTWPGPDSERLAHWLHDLAEPGPRDEQTSLALLGDFGIPVIEHRKLCEMEAVMAGAEDLGFPLVLKSAAPGLLHKTDQGGVATNLRNPAQLADAYREMATRLGPDVLLMRQADSGVEIALGMKRDPQFGVIVVVAAGGTLIEERADRAVSLAPVSAREAGSMLESLSIYPSLKGGRGRPGSDIPALVDLVVRFSRLAAALGPCVVEMDINPVIAGSTSIDVVDALVIAG